MTRRTIGIIAGLILMTACGARAREQTRRLDELRAAIGTEPVDPRKIANLSTEQEALHVLTSELEARAEKKENAALDWQAGECHRLRHLLDEPGAWEAAERRFQLALARDPSLTRAHLSLGQLYLTGGFEFSPRAEREFVQALEKGGSDSSAGRSGGQAAAHKGLFMAYYYQGRFDEALRESDQYLAIVGSDVDVQKMRAMAEANRARAAKVSG